MGSSPPRLTWGLVGTLLAVLAGCSDSGAPRVKAGSGYTAVVNWAVAHEFPDRGPDDPTPLVFIATSDGSIIPASTQAKVTRDAEDKITVNFVDRREDAIDAEDPVEAVKNDGLLVTVGPIPSDARSSFELEVSLYTNYVDKSLWRLLLVADATDDTVTVTQAEELKPAQP